MLGSRSVVRFSFLSIAIHLVVLLVLGHPLGASAGGRELTMTLGTDYYGRDFATLKGVTLERCKSACLDDARCQAFTFNTKAGWCFLKESSEDPRPFEGAVSGRIREAGMSGVDLMATRASELSFLPPRELGAARDFVDRLAKSAPKGVRRETLVAQARAAMAAENPLRAVELYSQALGLGSSSRELWMALSQAASAASPSDWSARQRLKKEAEASAINAYLRSEGVQERADVLERLGLSLADRQQWRPAIRSTRASLALVESERLRAYYDKLIAEHGFRVTGHKVDSDAANPRICIQFSDPLARDRANLTDFVRVIDRTDLPVEVEDRQMCIDGVRHGERYAIQVRSGLPAADGEVLIKGSDLDIYVRDRSPMVRFLGRAYVLPKGGEAAIPLVSVNTDLIDAQVYRIGDRTLTQAMDDGIWQKQLDNWSAGRIKEALGESIWKGSVEVRSQLNREVTTAVPVGAVVTDLEPGAYAMTARAHNATGDSDTRATQWFVVTDLGLATFSGNDGLHALVRSLSSAKSVAGVSVRLVAVNNEILGRATTDDRGYARFDPGLVRGKGGNAPALLVAEGEDGDYAFLDLTQTPFDLSDRGVDGRLPPKPLDVYLVSERGAYRPGEVVHLTALIRDAQAKAVPDLPITFVVKRPDGVEYLRQLTQDAGQGGHPLDVSITRTAMRGTWQASVYSDPKASSLADLSFLVEDFEPERLTFDLDSDGDAIDPDDPAPISLDARFLYGAPAAGLAVEGEVRVKPVDRLAGFEGYRFGLESESFEPVGGSLPASETDGQGKAEVALTLPDLPPTSKPLQASLQLRVVDDNGRPVERSLTLPIADRQGRIGVKPLFEGSVDEGGNARFEILAIDADGQRTALSSVRWTLSRVTTRFQWYESDGTWDYEPVTSTQRVASGELDLGTDGPGRIESPVEWGQYRLALESPDGSSLPVDLDFEAGWYVEPTAQDTPDLLKVSLDRPRYRVGETLKARLEPRFAGLALVMVIDDRLISMRTVAVPEEGAEVELPVTADWGPGAYVTAVLYRPMDLEAKRMPARAMGLTWATVDPGSRRLDLALDLPPALKGTVRPRQTIEIPVSVEHAPRGERVYVTVAAVDLGILNLTRYQPPAPDDWYFAQRRLGMEIRDLYGQLIDRMQGVPGLVRSGGDGALLKMEGPPPTEDLVAFHSGVVELDDQGRGRVSFDIPDFNGTVRVMAMAWSASGVGHAVADLLVRDPIVVSAALPRFLAPGDRTRILLNLTHVEGPVGDISVRVATEGGHSRVAPESAEQSATLTEGGRLQLRVPIEALTVGDDRLRIDLRTPDGQDLTKRLRMAVRSNAPVTSRRQIRELAPGAELRLDASWLSDRLPGTGSLLVSVGGAGRLDVAGLLMALDRYPYGCTEQLTSRALPLLYLEDVARSVGLAGDAKLDERVRTAIGDILANQGSNGSFGLWGSASGGDTWLDAYVTDFLTRAREKGYVVPKVAFDTALDNLRNALSYVPDFSDGGEDIAYALYVLARNGRAAIGDLRYYADTKLDAFATPMAKAQLGAALALYGDRLRADALFRNALAMWSQSREGTGWRRDYGSRLRDGAALLALAAETGTLAVDRQRLARQIQDAWDQDGYSSTQEQSWLLLAAHAMIAAADQPDLRVDGKRHEGGLYRRLSDEDLSRTPMRIENSSMEPLEVLLTVTGVPEVPEPAGGNGYRIERAYYDLDGRRIQPSGVAQGERMIAVVTVRSDLARQARLILDDPLPAGFEIDNPHLIKAGAVKDIPWLGLEDQARHAEFRADRFVAAIDRSQRGATQFQFAYRLRAVSPGVFAHPAATVEDMYRPNQRAWTGSDTVEVMERH